MANANLTVFNNQVVRVQGLPVQITGGRVPPSVYASKVLINGADVLASETATLDAGSTAMVTITSTPFKGTVFTGIGPVPAGKMVTSIEVGDGGELLSNEMFNIPYDSVIEFTPTYADIPTVVATFGSGLATDKPYTSVHLVVTHSDGTSESVIGGYQFRNGDIVNIAGTEYTAPGPTYDSPTITVPTIGSTVKIVSINVDGQPNTQPGSVVKLPEGSHVDIQAQPIISPKIKVPTFDFPVAELEVSVVGSSGEITKLSQGQTYMLDGSGQTVELNSQHFSPSPTYVQLPQIPPGEMVTDYSLAGATQGQSAALEPGEAYELETVTEEYAVEVNVNYVNTTAPNVNPAKEGG